MTRPGLRKMRCEVCGAEVELEAGIKTMYHCARPMEDVEDEGEEERGPAMRLEQG